MWFKKQVPKYKVNDKVYVGYHGNEFGSSETNEGVIKSVKEKDDSDPQYVVHVIRNEYKTDLKTHHCYKTGKTEWVFITAREWQLFDRQ